ncbi:MAG: aspartate kinase [Brevinema sp.]
MRLVLKYGGSSVATIEKIKAIAEYLVALKAQGNQLVVVASAMGKTTDSLISLAREVTPNPSLRELDALMSTGEIQTVSLLAIAAEALGASAVSLNGRQAGILTAGIPTKNQIKSIDPATIEAYLAQDKIVFVAGFQGVTAEGNISTLGRGGSDTSAVALAASLKCECRIYTDVDGIYGIDPRIYPAAKMLDRISYDEMMDMAHLGAKVMETRAVEIGKKFGVPIFVGRTLSQTGGTYIVEKEYMLEDKLITGISITREIEITTLAKLNYTASAMAEIFTILNNCGVNINLIIQNIHDGIARLSFSSIPAERFLLDKALERIRKIQPEMIVDINSSLGMISVVGIGMVHNSGVAGRFFTALSHAGVEFYQVSTSEISISCSVPRTLIDKAAQAAAAEFEL